MIKFTLNIENIKCIPFNSYEKDFTFIVDGEQYFTNRIIADILSPSIRSLHYTDKSVNEFYFNTNNPKPPKETNYFNEFLQLSSFENFELDENRKNYFSEYFLRLGNIEEYFRLNTKYYKDVTTENAIDYLISICEFQNKISKEFHIDPNLASNVFSQGENLKLIDFISQNFESINKKRIDELDVDLIERIISNDSLRLFEEDTLLLFLLNLYEKDVKYSPLFEYVIFQNVSLDTLTKFVSAFSMEDMNESIWKSVIFRLFQKKNETQKVRYIERKNEGSNKVIQYHSNIKNFEYRKGSEFEGILRHLTYEVKKNIHENGTIQISSNSIAFDMFQPKNLVDYESSNYYFSKDVPNSFVCFDFKEKSVKLSSYSIKSHSDGKNCGHLKNWVIETSDNGKLWEIIDRRENCDILNGSNNIANFKIQNDEVDFSRFIRLRSIGNSWYKYGNHNQFYFTLIEFFGQIKYD